ncbi:MAG: 2-C-methyl-D-erythritol 4-phosphate cytidylyltransferase [Phycisphaerae bacterium]|nr:2-C-methyl-D-erythritol 4-phosphate cytidylyltransferase [Phycisphaerae bacterium]MDD5380584.1 2-C-methyl-D-erythritol 4-phosphate cytidylyltransferase [Phycisphaerae bacterium]
MSKKVGVIICAAGASNRFGGKRKKPFVDVDGRAAFLRSVEIFSGRDDVKQVLLAIASEDEELVNIKWGPNLKFFNVKTYFGGAGRFDTVQKGLELIKDDIELIAVHDAVRCCVKEEWIDKVIAEAAKTGAAMLACPVVATIKEVTDSIIIRTVDRTGLYEAQTPQVFEVSLLKKAYANLKNLDKNKISDDSQLAEAIGQKVSIVETDSSNIKITRQSDIAIAEAILKSRPKPIPKGPIGPYIEAQW